MARAIDVEKLDRLAAQITRPVLDRMLVRFSERLAESRAAIAAAAASNGSDVALRHEAHKLLGVAGTFGATATAEAAAAVETAIDEGRAHEARAAVPQLLAAIDAAEAALKKRV